ncbi:MAG: hypothetical protein ILO36_00390 [Abditibacteriota bacterium]|nr:hypothetical protein [Abditibacteriota bacterium]
MGKKELHVISHTHWDREWYYTRQQFQVQLVDLFDNLLNILDKDPSFRFFNMDCQTIVLEDYLQVKPQNRAKLEKYIKEGRIVVGPWYQLNDENLVSGESTVRSLLIGSAIAREFGARSDCGYLPDQFGNVSQMPQIFRGFGIDNSVMGRGFDAGAVHGDGESLEFIWKGSDGSEVLSSAMVFWYNNFQRIPENEEEALEFLNGVCDRMAPLSAAGPLLLMNGVDHFEPQHNAGELIEKLNEKLEDRVLIHSTLDKYMDAVKKAVKDNNVQIRTYPEAELRYDNNYNVLAGTLTARLYLKQANNTCEQNLEKVAEPVNAFNMITGGEYYEDFIRLAWKTLMQNHPHDSICGCSIDRVHTDMTARFQQVGDWTERVTRKAAWQFTEKIATDDKTIVVFNPLNYERSEVMDVDLYYQLNDKTRGVPLPPDPARDVAAFRITAPDGEEMPFFVVDNTVELREITHPVELPMAARFRHFRLKLFAKNVPALGYKAFTVTPQASWPVFDKKLAPRIYKKNAITNGLVTVKLDKGAVHIKDLSLGKTIDNAGMIEESGCCGDEYRYIKPMDDEIITSHGAMTGFSVKDQSPVSASLIVRYDMKVPADSDIHGRSETLVSCPVTVTYTVNAGSPRVDIRAEIENNAKNHRFRMMFPTGVSTDKAYAEMPFDVYERDKERPENWRNFNPGCAQKTFVCLSDGIDGVTVINKGLPEYEALSDKDSTVAVTLLRSTGILSGGGDVAGDKYTPDAQCPGRRIAETAVCMHKGGYADSESWNYAHSFNAPMYYRQTEKHEGALPKEFAFVTISSGKVAFSALKKAERENAVILRVYNPTCENLEGVRIGFPAGFGEARLVNLNEETLETLPAEDNAVTVDIGPKKIITIAFALEKEYEKPYPPLYMEIS